MPALVVVAGVDIAFAYTAFDRGAVETVLGGVIALGVMALCIFRPRPALLAFAGSWGVVHVLLSNGELEKTGGVSASISQLLGVTVVLGFGIAVVGLHSRRGSRPLPFPLRAFAMFAVVYALAELITPFHAAGLSDLFKIVGGVVLAFIGYYVIDDEKRLLALARAVGIAGVLVAVGALAQFTFGSGLTLQSQAEISGPYRATSVLGSANGTAEFLLICAGFVLLRYALRRDRYRVRADLTTLAIVSIGIVVTFTRADIIALVVMLVVWAALWQVRSTSAIGPRVRLATIAVAGAVAVVQVVGSASLISRAEGRLHSSGTAQVLTGREAIWSNELHKLESADLGTTLIGSGAHTSNTSVYVPQSEKYVEYPPHDLFLWLAIETGLVGLVVYGSALFSLSRSFLTVARGSRFTPSGQVAAVAFATTIAVILDSMFHNTQVSTDSEWYFMLFVGVTLRKIERR